MYSIRPGLLIGFHGCDRQVMEKVVSTPEGLKPSDNSYDWLGNGVYFWENNLQRALDYAGQLKKAPERTKGSV